jgi:hypothetical protein
LQPGDISVESSTQVQARFIKGLLGGHCPKVQVVSGRLALETLESVLGQIDREYAAVVPSVMKGTGSAELSCGRLSRFEPKEYQNLGHGHEGADFSKVDSRHRTYLGTEKRCYVGSESLFVSSDRG